MLVDPMVYGYVVKEEIYPEKAVIIEDGGGGEWIDIILNGQVKVKKRTPIGMVSLDTLKKGDIFGEMSLLAMGMTSRSASIVAEEGSVRVGILDTERIVSIMNQSLHSLKDCSGP